MVPEVGVYKNIPFEEYLAWDAVSNSRLSLMARSPLHYQAGFKAAPTTQMRLGSLSHCGVLEPLSIVRRYVFMPDYASHPDNATANGVRSFSASTKFVKQMEEDFRKLHHDKEIVTEAEYERMVGVARSLATNPVTRELLSSGQSEVSVVWVDQDTGLLCKMRADWLRDFMLIDLKTCADAQRFESSIVRYGYHRQMAFYLEGVRSIGHEATPWMIAVEPSEPYGVRAAPMDPAWVALGMAEVRTLMRRVVECQESGVWPGYENPSAWTMPPWLVAQDEEVELNIGGELLTM